MTFSIVAKDSTTGDLGIAVASRFLATGAGTPFVRAGVGAIATQSFENQQSAMDGLALMEAGASAAETVARLVEADPNRSERQLGAVDRDGQAATYTGPRCFAWAGGVAGEGFAAQGNILAGPDVIEALAGRFIAGGLPLPELLLASLEAGDKAGGDRRGRQSAVLLVGRVGYRRGWLDDRYVDLRVDDNPCPVQELRRLLALHRQSRERSREDQLVPIDASVAMELSKALEAVGAVRSGRRAVVMQRMSDTTGRRARYTNAPLGSRKGNPKIWDDFWQDALSDWMAIQNLEELMVRPGWVDPKVLMEIRARAGAETPTERK